MVFSIRTWGTGTTELMRLAYDCGVIGMTMNAPELLCEYVQSKAGK